MAANAYAVPESGNQVTEWLIAWSQGDDAALERLMPVVHAELYRLARRAMRHERAGHTLQTTALVNEAYLRLVNLTGLTWTDRAHFFALSARLMRRILVDHARARGYVKRGGGTTMVPLNDPIEIGTEPGADLVALDEALQSLAELDARKSQVVELRFFGGLDVDETAAALQISPATVVRDWRLAKAWLLKELGRRD